MSCPRFFMAFGPDHDNMPTKKLKTRVVGSNEPEAIRIMAEQLAEEFAQLYAKPSLANAAEH